MFRAIITAAIAGLALSGCVTRTMDAPANYAWSYSANADEGAKLAFGRPQSDEVVLMMVCDDRRVQLSAAGLNSPKLTLVSGETRTSIDGVIGEGFAGAPGLIEASASMRAPALEAFSQSGDLDLTSGGRTIRMTASDADRPAVKRFFRACQT